MVTTVAHPTGVVLGGSMAAFGHCHWWLALADHLLGRGGAWLEPQLYLLAVSTEIKAWFWMKNQ